MRNVVEVTVTTTLAEQQQYYMELTDQELAQFRAILFEMSQCRSSPLLKEAQVMDPAACDLSMAILKYYVDIYGLDIFDEKEYTPLHEADEEPSSSDVS